MSRPPQQVLDELPLDFAPEPKCKSRRWRDGDSVRDKKQCDTDSLRSECIMKPHHWPWSFIVFTVLGAACLLAGDPKVVQSKAAHTATKIM